MGWFKSGFRVVNYVFTLGGSYEVEEAQRKYKATYCSYKKSHDEITITKQRIDNILKDIGQDISNSQVTINKTDRLIKATNK